MSSGLGAPHYVARPYSDSISGAAADYTFLGLEEPQRGTTPTEMGGGGGDREEPEEELVHPEVPGGP